MARTIKEWYNLIATQKTSFSSLSDYTVINDAQDLLTQLTTTSKVGVFSLFIWVWAFSAWTVEKFWLLFKDDVNTTIANDRTPTANFIKSLVLAFQYDLSTATGFSIVETDGKPAYATVDETKQIIARCAVVEASTAPHFIKVAIDTGGGVLAAANTATLTALSDYFEEVKPFGLKVQFISLNPDKMRYAMDFYYDPYIASDTAVLSQIEAAIEEYHEELDFNGSVDLNKLEDKLQAIEAHKRHRITAASGQSGNTVTAFTSIYPTVAGWCILHDTAPNRLEDTVNLIAV